MIIDLEAGNEFTFECPFPPLNDYATYTAVIGRLSLFVLTPLAVAGGASNEIDITVETSMRADASFIYPRGEATRWIQDGLALAEKKRYRIGNKHLHPQSGKVRPTMTYSLPSNETAPIDLTNNVEIPFSDPVDREMACAGDSCRTLRMYFKRGMVHRVTSQPITILANSLDSLEDSNQTMFLATQWYCLMRGSMRYNIHCNTATYMFLYDADDDVPPSTATETGYAQHLKASQMCTMEVPMYHVNPWRYCLPVAGDGKTGTNFSYPVIDSDGSTLTYDIMATAADDFDLCFFRGISPVLDPTP
jgi:hypothetical protein